MKNLFDVTLEDKSTPQGYVEVWIMCDVAVKFADALARYRKLENDSRPLSYWKNIGPVCGREV